MDDRLGQRVVSALKWMAAARLLSQLASWVITIVVIRLLAPDDYGLMAMAMAVITFLNLLAEMGMGAALIQKRDLDQGLVREAYTLALAVNGLLYVALYHAALPLASFFGESRLVDVVRVIGLQFFLLALSIVPQSMLEKRMEFNRRAIVELVSTIIGSLFTLYLALEGKGVWSLVYGNLLRMFVRMLGLNLLYPYLRIPTLRLGRVLGIAKFGGWVTLERLLWYLYTESDIFIIGRMLGNEILGLYSVARQLAALPSQKLNAIMTQVSLPAFSALQDERERFRSAFLKATRLISVFAIPVFFGISAVAPEAVSVLLGDKWQEVVLPIQLLALVMPLKMLGANVPTAVKAVGRPDVNVVNLALACIIVPSAVFFGTRWGLTGVVVAWCVAYPLAFAVMLMRSIPLIGIGIGEFAAAVTPSLMSGIVMYIAIVAERMLFGQQVEVTARFLLLVLSGMLAYPLVSLMVNRQASIELLSFIYPVQGRKMRSR